MRNPLWNETEFQKIKNGTPGIGRVLETYGHQTLRDYFRSIIGHAYSPIQKRSDLIEVGQDFIRPLLGADMPAGWRPVWKIPQNY